MWPETVPYVALVIHDREQYLKGKITRVGLNSTLSTTDESVIADRQN